MSRASEALREGFFADRVVRSLRRDMKIGPEHEELLRQIKEYFDRVDNGRRQVSTGKLSDNAIDSLSAYNRMLSIIVRMSPRAPDKKAIDSLTSTMRKEIEDALHEQKVSSDKMPLTLRFFQFVREGTLQESASTFGLESVERPKKIGTP